MRYFGGIGNPGCPTVTSAAARGALHWRRLQLSLLNIHAGSGARRAALVALAAPAAQSFPLQWLCACCLGLSSAEAQSALRRQRSQLWRSKGCVGNCSTCAVAGK